MRSTELRELRLRRDLIESLERHTERRVMEAFFGDLTVARKPAKHYAPASRVIHPEDELRRLADGTPQCWFSPLRDRLIKEGVVEVVLGPDGRWRGDRITEAGKAALERLS